MNKAELKRWREKVIKHAELMIANNGRENAAQRIWRLYGTPTEVKYGKLAIWFCQEKVEL